VRDWGEAMTDGLVTLPSNYPVPETIDRLRDAVTAAGLQVFARVDHAAGAREVGLDLRPTELLMFGNARGGTPLMQDKQTAGIDLPLKVLAWADESGQTWLSTGWASRARPRCRRCAGRSPSWPTPPRAPEQARQAGPGAE
jgi:uncharacterized protein (DUF302 family)